LGNKLEDGGLATRLPSWGTINFMKWEHLVSGTGFAIRGKQASQETGLSAGSDDVHKRSLEQADCGRKI
jgi:hypothetical protein